MCNVMLFLVKSYKEVRSVSWVEMVINNINKEIMLCEYKFIVNKEKIVYVKKNHFQLEFYMHKW